MTAVTRCLELLSLFAAGRRVQKGLNRGWVTLEGKGQFCSAKDTRNACKDDYVSSTSLKAGVHTENRSDARHISRNSKI